MPDFRWMSRGGTLIDSTGDIASWGSMEESVVDVVRSRLKAAVNGWKAYAIGAGLQDRIGDTVDPELEIKIQRQVADSLTRSFLSRSDFSVKTIAQGDQIRVLVYINRKLVAQAMVSPDQVEVLS